MDIDEQFDSLSLPREKQSLAWEARAKITWGDPPRDVQMWLEDNGIDYDTAERIIAIAVRDRAISLRIKGLWDLILGIPCMGCGAGVGLGFLWLINLGLFAFPVRGAAVLEVFAFLGFMYGVHLTWRGLFRVIGGARMRGAVSDVVD